MQLRTVLAPKQILTLRQVLSPKMIQMLKTFNLSYSDLVETIQNENDNNVFLDVVRFDQLTEQYSVRKTAQSQESFGKDVGEYRADLSKGSLHEFLLTQLDLEQLDSKASQIAQFLIEHIDDRGYLADYVRIRDQAVNQFNVKDRKVNDVLKIIQTFEPDGVGARTLKECLLIQIEAYNFEHEKLRDILVQVVREYFDDLADKKFDRIAQKLKIEPEAVENIASFIKSNLNPSPGSAFSKSSFVEMAIPSFEAKVVDHKIHLTNLEKEKGVQVRFSDQYLSAVNDPNTDAKTRDYLKEQMSRAQELVENINRRAQNLERLITFISERQFEFFSKGKHFLVPLLQKEVANSLGISSSTVSRILSSKYIQTPNGVLALKFLCPRNFFGNTQDRFRHILKTIFTENASLSDQEISNLLKEKGIKIARRTVAKYRQELGVDSSYVRKQK